ncbi:NUDIX domain-containing protein [Pasteurella skyensis]|uniref:NUDIX domain-containing protein n=1 Tax=Phocoenobacter skyensis TaxID=97481 RepID=A0AAJ6NBJ7_9PAST|nr:NUDIX domain-containing protein [Pasteurella skyensis]MDP8163449.1 NUDIX domain-containing protein [Pasteurella skyensis]MDP8173740.1 NUDIX domain-containing protein [Pasteurella skyensis]MDP8177792.1 NUDIX domain-containing protein [Pasteurella skyensis]MDP8179898.1 NUDIX domain-containing protein [Pasteurella skyensis]MDP8184012.1 NUDIX domain-containing protein [Pasteurella skyensis]
MKTEIDKLAWLYIKDNQVLMARSKGKEKFYLPGGKREQGEDDKTALIREIKEELCVDLFSDTIEYAGTFFAQADGKPLGYKVKLTCYAADFKGECKADQEIEEIRWISYQEKDKCSLVAQIVLETLKEKQILN